MRLVFVAFLGSISFSLLGYPIKLQQRIQDLNAVDFYLHTIDVSDRLYDNFGHTAIRLVERASNTDLIFNWGLFDFSDPISFGVVFYRGILRYKLGVYPYDLALQIYQRDRRTVWEDKLMLTLEEKSRLFKRLVWNIDPANIFYNYQYFFDNCSTRPRDYIDEALKGRVSKLFSNTPSAATFRDMVRAHFKTNPFIELSLDILMNSRIDNRMVLWQQAFLPKALRDMLFMVKATDADSDPEGGGALLAKGRVIYHFSRPKPFSFDIYKFIFAASMMLLALIAATLIAGNLEKPLAPYISSFGYFMFGVVLVIFGCYFGTLGTLMPLNWLMSLHRDLHHNVNIAAFWPTDYLVVYLGYRFIRTRKPLAPSPSNLGFFSYYCWLKVVSLALFALVWLTFSPQQDISRVVGYIVPIWALAFLMIVFLGFERRGR